MHYIGNVWLCRSYPKESQFKSQQVPYRSLSCQPSQSSAFYFSLFSWLSEKCWRNPHGRQSQNPPAKVFKETLWAYILNVAGDVWLPWSVILAMFLGDSKCSVKVCTSCVCVWACDGCDSLSRTTSRHFKNFYFIWRGLAAQKLLSHNICGKGCPQKESLVLYWNIVIKWMHWRLTTGQRLHLNSLCMSLCKVWWFLWNVTGNGVRRIVRHVHFFFVYMICMCMICMWHQSECLKLAFDALCQFTA